MAVKVAEGVIEIKADAAGVPRQIRNAVDGAGPEFDESGRRSGGRILGGIGLALGAAAVTAIGIGVGQAISAGIRTGFDFTLEGIGLARDLNETRNAVGEVFGAETAREIEQWASGANRNLGQTQQQALAAAQNFGIFGKSAGLVGGDLADFSIEMTNLSSDLASFQNTTPQEAIDALGAALRGESEPIRRYGVLLDDATLKARALEMGIISTTNQALTPQQRVLAAQAEILAQTSTQQGDFARTSGDLSNQQRILAASFDEAKARLGTALLPALTTLTTFANDSLIPALNEIIDEVGPEMGEAFVDMVPGIIDLVEALVPLMPLLIDLAISALPGVIATVEALVPLITWWAEESVAVMDFTALLFEMLNGDVSVTDFMSRVDALGGTFGDVAQGFVDFITDLTTGTNQLATDVGIGVGNVVNFFATLPDRIQFYIDIMVSRAQKWGNNIMREFLVGIETMTKPITDAVGGIMDKVRGFFPSSPAKFGAFAGEGWTALGRSGEAIIDQFTSRMNPVIPLRIDGAGLDASARSLASRFDMRGTTGAGGASGSGATVTVQQTIQTADPMLGGRLAAREITKYLGV